MSECFSEGPVSPDGSSPPRATTGPSEPSGGMDAAGRDFGGHRRHDRGARDLRAEYEVVEIDQLDDSHAVWLTAAWRF